MTVDGLGVVRITIPPGTEHPKTTSKQTGGLIQDVLKDLSKKEQIVGRTRNIS